MIWRLKAAKEPSGMATSTLITDTIAQATADLDNDITETIIHTKSCLFIKIYINFTTVSFSVKKKSYFSLSII